MKTLIPNRRHILVSLCSVVLAAFGILLAQSSLTPFTIKIGTKHQVVRVGEPVEIYIVLTNTSDHQIIINKGSIFDYDVKVWNADGTVPPDTENGRNVRDKAQPRTRLSVFTEYLAPKRYVVDWIGVNELNDMSNPGQYTIQIERAIPPHLGYGVVNRTRSR